MKKLFLLIPISVALFAEQGAPADTLSNLRIRNANLIYENSKQQARIAGLEAQVKDLEGQIGAMRKLEVMAQVCPPIALEKCSIGPDGTISEKKEAR